mmetsp:Transcript_13327/g.36156  ORF Transcript_13327/g.36156 Transcript_13327/m.36156 type:complete len:230 (-) Transcript_13327:77-766(-)
MSEGTVTAPFPVTNGTPATLALWPLATFNADATPFQTSPFTCFGASVDGAPPSRNTWSPGCDPGGGSSMRTTRPLASSRSAASNMASLATPASLAGFKLQTATTKRPCSCSLGTNCRRPAQTCRCSPPTSTASLYSLSLFGTSSTSKTRATFSNAFWYSACASCVTAGCCAGCAGGGTGAAALAGAACPLEPFGTACAVVAPSIASSWPMALSSRATEAEAGGRGMGEA